MKVNPGKPVSEGQVARFVGIAYGRASTVGTAASGFRKAGIYPYNPDVFEDWEFAPSSVTDRGDFIEPAPERPNTSVDEPLADVDPATTGCGQGTAVNDEPLAHINPATTVCGQSTTVNDKPLAHIYPATTGRGQATTVNDEPFTHINPATTVCGQSTTVNDESLAHINPATTVCGQSTTVNDKPLAHIDPATTSRGQATTVNDEPLAHINPATTVCGQSTTVNDESLAHIDPATTGRGQSSTVNDEPLAHSNPVTAAHKSAYNDSASRKSPTTASSKIDYVRCRTISPLPLSTIARDKNSRSRSVPATELTGSPYLRKLQETKQSLSVRPKKVSCVKKLPFNRGKNNKSEKKQTIRKDKPVGRPQKRGRPIVLKNSSPPPKKCVPNSQPSLPNCCRARPTSHNSRSEAPATVNYC